MYGAPDRSETNRDKFPKRNGPGRERQLKAAGSGRSIHAYGGSALPGYNASTDQPGAKLLYRAEEAADLLSISRTAVFNLIRSGDLPGIKIGGRRRIPRASIDDYIERQLAAGTEQPLAAASEA